MRIDEYQRLYDLEQHYWWHQGRRHIITSLLAKELKGKPPPLKILDIGCGTGFNFEILRKFGTVTGLDNSEEALKFCRKRGINDLLIGDAEHLNLPESSFDVITAFDILEHLKDDEAALASVYRTLKPGGIFFLLSPAYQFLWSGHDEALQHQRRYLLSEMHRKLDIAGFRMVKRSYCITTLFLPIVFFRLFGSLWAKKKSESSYVMLPRPLNTLFVWMLRGEAALLKIFNLPFGVSILCIAEK